MKLHLAKTDLLTTTGLQDTREFVKQSKEKAAKQLAAAEKRLIAFRKDHRIVALTTQQEVSLRKTLTEYGLL